MTPTIGIPLCLDARGRWRAGRDYHYIDAAYASAVSRAGGHAIYLPEPADAEAAIEVVHALLVPGGDDFVPPEPRSGSRFEPTSERQLQFDRTLLGLALERGIPVLAICYGMQLLALHAGGTLHYDLPVDLPDAANHRLLPGTRHAIEIEPDSALAVIANGAGAEVNCWHHQSVASVPDPLHVTARTSDGVIEAIEDPTRPFCIGVQWHPERLDTDASARLFESFVRACL